MGIQDAIALTIAAGAVVWVGRSLWRSIHKGGCHCAHTGDSDSPRSTCSAAANGVKRIPLVTLDPIGKPTAANPSEPNRSDLA